MQANEDALNDKWVEILSAKQDLKEWHRSVPKSYPRRRLLPEFDDELTAEAPDRPPRGRDRPTREDFHTQPSPRHHGKDPVDYLDPQDV